MFLLFKKWKKQQLFLHMQHLAPQAWIYMLQRLLLLKRKVKILYLIFFIHLFLARSLISTGICVQFMDGYFGMIAPRSGLSWKHGLDIAGGVIDNDYRGIIKIILVNQSSIDYKVDKVI
jgi:hypothetical protein